MVFSLSKDLHIFISYSHEDTEHLERLKVHLAPYLDDGDLDCWLWDDTQILAGSKWQDDIERALQRADAAILLVSADFLASRFIRENELPPLLGVAEKKGIKVMPVILSPCGFERYKELSLFQVAHQLSQPLSSMHGRPKREGWWAQVAKNIYHATIARKMHKSVYMYNREGEKQYALKRKLAVPDLLRGFAVEGLFPDRLFLQYINPEILSLYGAIRKFKRQQLYKHVLRLTKFALLLSADILIMPASYLFEVGFISHFLKELNPLEHAGILQFASPSADLYEYVHTKKVEYRDELILFPEYARDGGGLISKSQSLSWIPRVQRSTAKDISIAWRQELYKNNGLWRQVLEEQAQKQSLLPSKLESAIELVPDHLEGRAFIFRYAESLLPMTLDPQEETQINMLICRTYLESYLEEFNAMILVDTPIGRLDCGLPQMNTRGSLRTISFRALSASFKMINILDYIDNRLSWHELIELRGQPAFRWLMALVVINMLDPSRPLNTAILKSRYQPKIFNHAFVKQPFQEANDHVLQLFETIEPFLKNI